MTDGAGPDHGDDRPPATAPPRTTIADLLAEIGVSPQEIDDARAHGHLSLLAVERLVLPDPLRYDLAEVSAATGLSVDLVGQLWRSLGFVEAHPGQRLFTDVDIEMLGSIAALLDSGLVDGELVVQMARVIGSSMARVASSLVDAIDPSDPVGTEHPSDDPDDERFAGVAPLLAPTLLLVNDYVWRRQVQVEARARMARDHAGADPDHRAVGFADLVGFTVLSQQVSAHELADVVDRFEGIAYDIVGRLGGRVVKMIGDEVMFAVDDEDTAAEIGLTLSETYRDDHHLADVRVGLAAGPVLQREADLFGPVVNRASRIVSLALPGSVLCDDAVHQALKDHDDLTWRTLGNRNLKNIGRVPVFVLRRSSGPHDDPARRAEAEKDSTARRRARGEELASRRRHGTP